MDIRGVGLKALLVDASAARYSALRAALEEQFSPVELTNTTGADGLATALMRRGWDVVLYSGERPGAVPPRKARALVRLGDPHLPFLSVSPAVRENDLLGLVKGFDGDVPVVANPSRVPDAIRVQMNVSDRRHPGGTHRLLLAQQAITDHIASGLEAPQLLERVAETLAETLGWTCAEVWRPAAGALVCTSAWVASAAGDAVGAYAASTRGATVVPGRGMAGRVFAFRRPAWVADLRMEPAGEAAAAAGLACGVAFPICLEDRCDGVIVLYAREPREPDAEASAMLAAVGGQLARYLSSGAPAVRLRRRSVPRF